jgi:hypothetical protein
VNIDLGSFTGPGPWCQCWGVTDRLWAAHTRRRDGALEERAWPRAEIGWLQEALPWRTFRWHHGQKHYPGTYWCATSRDHVIYESRLELLRLILADFDTAVRRIVAQPFLLTTVDGERLRKHVPDFLLITDAGPVVVDVKPSTV